MLRTRLIWTFIITSVAAFMVGLDNLVVTMALPSIRSHLHASLASLEWTINAYTLSFAVLIITGAAPGRPFRATANAHDRADRLHPGQRGGGVGPPT